MHHFFFVMMTNSMSAIWKEGHLLFRANCKVRTGFRFLVLLCVGKEHIETIWRPLANDKCCGTRKKLHKVSAQLHADCADRLLTQVLQTIVMFRDISAELQFSCCKLHCSIESVVYSVFSAGLVLLNAALAQAPCRLTTTCFSNIMQCGKEESLILVLTSSFFIALDNKALLLMNAINRKL